MAACLCLSQKFLHVKRRVFYHKHSYATEKVWKNHSAPCWMSFKIHLFIGLRMTGQKSCFLRWCNFVYVFCTMYVHYDLLTVCVCVISLTGNAKKLDFKGFLQEFVSFTDNLHGQWEMATKMNWLFRIYNNQHLPCRYFLSWLEETDFTA